MEYQMSDAEIAEVAKQYMGKTAVLTVVFSIVAVGLYVAVFTGTLLGYLPLSMGFLMLAYLVFVIYTPLHEAVHNNICGSNRRLRWLNNLIGYTVASVLGISFTMHKSAHLTHHRMTNVPDEDPDLGYSNTSFLGLLLGGTKVVVMEYQSYFKKVFPRAKRSDQLVVVFELLIAVGWRLALAVAGYPLEVFLLAIVANIAGVAIVGYLFAYAVHSPYDQTDRFKNTNTIILPHWIHGLATLLWLWQNYHSIHHLYPKIPFYQYAEVFNQIESGMSERGAPIQYAWHQPLEGHVS